MKLHDFDIPPCPDCGADEMIAIATTTHLVLCNGLIKR